MNKININLNPRQEKAGAPLARTFMTYLPLLNMAAIGVGAILAVIAIVLVVRFGIYRGLLGQWKQWEAKAQDLAAVKKSISTLQDEKKELTRILTPRLEAARLFEGFFSAFPENMWLDEFTYRADTLRLKGYVLSWKEDQSVSLDTFIKALKKNDYLSSQFKKFGLVESQKSNYNSVDVLEFAIECVTK